MSEVSLKYDDEIDLYVIVETLWDGKWKKSIATTFAAAVIGVVFGIAKQNSFEVSTPIQSGRPSVFLQYTLLNDLLKSNQFDLSIDENSTFEMFIVEFTDYEEMVDAVSASEFVQKSINDLEDDDKRTALNNFAKAFEIKKNGENWKLSFEWHDVSEGMRLFNDGILQTLLNIRNNVTADINELADAIDLPNKRNLEKMRSELSLIEQNQTNKNR